MIGETVGAMNRVPEAHDRIDWIVYTVYCRCKSICLSLLSIQFSSCIFCLPPPARYSMVRVEYSVYSSVWIKIMLIFPAGISLLLHNKRQGWKRWWGHLDTIEDVASDTRYIQVYTWWCRWCWDVLTGMITVRIPWSFKIAMEDHRYLVGKSSITRHSQYTPVI